MPQKQPPARMARSSVIGILHLVQVSPIALGLHIVAMDKPQGGRVDAIPQSAAVLRTVREHVPEMAVAVRRAHLGARHAVRSVSQLVDVVRFYGFGEAGPAASRLILVGGREQRLTRHNVDVDARFLVIQILPGSGGLRAVLLRYAILLRREPRESVRVLAEFSHCFLLVSDVNRRNFESSCGANRRSSRASMPRGNG